MGAGGSKQVGPISDYSQLTGRINPSALRAREREFREEQSAYEQKILKRKMDVNKAIKLANEARIGAEDAASGSALIRRKANDSKEKATNALQDLQAAREAFGKNTDYTDANTKEIGSAINEGIRVAQNAIHVADRVLASIGTEGAGAGAATSFQGGRRRTRRQRVGRK